MRTDAGLNFTPETVFAIGDRAGDPVLQPAAARWTLHATADICPRRADPVLGGRSLAGSPTVGVEVFEIRSRAIDFVLRL